MKKRKSTRKEDYNPEERKRSIHFKKKKQRFEENYFNPKRLTKLEDFNEFDEDDERE
jgi:hypothetical protein